MYYLGIDLGGTNAAAGVVNKNYEIIGKASVPTNSKDGVDAIVENIAKAGKQAISEAKITENDIVSIGIGSPALSTRKTASSTLRVTSASTIRRLQSLSANIFPGKKYPLKTTQTLRRLPSIWRVRQGVLTTASR